MNPRAIVLDSAPLSLLCGPPRRADVVACRLWCDSLILAGNRVVIPEVIDYEVRRELLRAKKAPSAARVTALRLYLDYLPLTTAAIERAAEWWAYARHTGQPTAPDPRLDIDMILVAQAELLGLPNAVIATSNMNHIPRFHAADLWTAITP